MSRLRLFVSSLLISASLAGAATAKTTVAPMPPGDSAIVQIDRAQVRARLAERRKVVVERFLKYREARVYPWNNSFMPMPQHLWFDSLGNLCAAATLISYDWGRESTKKVGEKDRGIALAKVKTGDLMDWILTSGLTHHEIVAIQAPAIGVDNEELRMMEIERLYALYTDVERQLTTLSDDNLDLATDALMKRPDLARKLLAGNLPGPGKYRVIHVHPPMPPLPPGTPVGPMPAEPVSPPTEPAPAA
jgi:hypothetical protein